MGYVRGQPVLVSRDDTWRSFVQKQELEVQVGDTLHIGDYTITIVDLDGDEVGVRIDSVDELIELGVEDGVVTIKS